MAFADGVLKGIRMEDMKMDKDEKCKDNILKLSLQNDIIQLE